jgi:hypothetical protein
VPTPVAAVFAAAGLQPESVVGWGERIAEAACGVYVVALTDEPESLACTLPNAPISEAAIEHLLKVRPELTLDGTRPSSTELSARIGAFWLPDELILYIGLATSLRSRIGSFYTTPIGARRPHSGGWFLKTLSNVDRLFVHSAHCGGFDTAETVMLEAFVGAVSPVTRAALADPAHPWPFANLELLRGGRKIRKAHGIKGARGDLAARDEVERRQAP